MTADQVLTDSSGSPKGIVFGTNEFYLSFVVAPRPDSKPWTLQFGGHHLALNLTLAGTNNTPQPEPNGHSARLRIRATENLSPAGNGERPGVPPHPVARCGPAKRRNSRGSFHDLVLGPGRDGVTLAPEGIPPPAAGTAAQRHSCWISRASGSGSAPEPQATARLAEVSRNLEETSLCLERPDPPGSALFPHPGSDPRHRIRPQNLGARP